MQTGWARQVVEERATEQTNEQSHKQTNEQANRHQINVTNEQANEQTQKQTAINPEHNSDATWPLARTPHTARAQVTTVGCFAGDYKWHGGLVDAFGHIWCAGVVCLLVRAVCLFDLRERRPGAGRRTGPRKLSQG